MHQMAPPELPRVALADGDGMQRLRGRLLLIWVTLATILLTAWCIKLGPLPAILALVTAKHVLVAVLVMGLKVDQQHEAEL